RPGPVRAAPLLLVPVLFLGACAGQPAGRQPLPPPGSAAGAPGDVLGEWVATALAQDGEVVPLPDGREGTLEIGSTRLGGTAFCNGFGGDYELVEDRLEVRELLSTAMACDGDVATAEGLYFRALNASDARLTVRNGELVLGGDGVEVRFVPRPPVSAADLGRTSWLLQGVGTDGTSTIALGQPALLDLRPDGTFRAGTGCGTVSGTWHAEPDGVGSSVVQHETDCPPELAQQDELVTAVLAQGFRARLSDGRLTLTDAEGRSIEYVDPADARD
ncbi:MAG: META domain-containing protein, partial [Actinomycetes bacterium]